MRFTTLLGPEEVHAADLDSALFHLAHRPRAKPFAPARVAFVLALAERLVQGPKVREFPELAALGHWFRASAVHRLANGFAARSRNGALLTRARGLVLLMPPANVDVLFGYAWLLSLMAGNATVVRASQKRSAMREHLIEQARFVGNSHADALADTWIITYPHDDALTSLLSQRCDARLVWGGDDTVRRIRTLPLKPTAAEAAFADRFSCAVFAAESIASSPGEVLDTLVAQFANDSLWADQQACSSPKAVFWIGSAAAAQYARSRFWEHFARVRSLRDPGPAARVSRVSDILSLAAIGAVTALDTRRDAYPARASGPALVPAVVDRHGGYGWFFEVVAPDVDTVAAQLEDRVQTVVVHGLPADATVRLACAVRGRGVDRMVRVGRAIEFNHVWDGQDLFDLLTRLVWTDPLRSRIHEPA
jgi:hypothetical protein